MAFDTQPSQYTRSDALKVNIIKLHGTVRDREMSFHTYNQAKSTLSQAVGTCGSSINFSSECGGTATSTASGGCSCSSVTGVSTVSNSGILWIPSNSFGPSTDARCRCRTISKSTRRAMTNTRFRRGKDGICISRAVQVTEEGLVPWATNQKKLSERSPNERAQCCLLNIHGKTHMSCDLDEIVLLITRIYTRWL